MRALLAPAAIVLSAPAVIVLSASAAVAHGAVDASHRAEQTPAGKLAVLPWSDDWFVWLLLAASLLLYAHGFPRVWRSASPARRREHRRDAILFVTGWLVLFVALVSPLHPWGELLFSAHMLQHELLMIVAAPLLVLGRPWLAFTRVLPPSLLRHFFSSGAWPPGWRRAWRLVSLPIAAWAIHAVALWIWHLPQLFEATLRSDLVHTAQHASFFLTALLFWWSLLRRHSGTADYGAAVLYLFTTSVQSGALGALLTLARRSFYPAYALTAPDWGLSPLEHQQLGGLIMWIPAGLVYVGAALALLLLWMRDSERRVEARERPALLASERSAS